MKTIHLNLSCTLSWRSYQISLLTAGAIDKALNSVEELEVCVPEKWNKIELDEKLHFNTMELLYFQIFLLVVEGLVLTRILAQLM
jgi:hypothetical protein